MEYAKQRLAFGRPIGAFQAIKHQLAEIAGQGECAKVAVQYAAWALSEGDPRASLAVAMAQSYNSDAYIATRPIGNIQVFGHRLHLGDEEPPLLQARPLQRRRAALRRAGHPAGTGDPVPGEREAA